MRASRGTRSGLFTRHLTHYRTFPTPRRGPQAPRRVPGLDLRWPSNAVGTNLDGLHTGSGRVGLKVPARQDDFQSAPMARNQAVTDLIESGYPLGTIETPLPERVVGLFKHRELATGEALYVWRPGKGLRRVGMEYIKIPRTQTLSETLDFVVSSIHFGVYLILGAGEALLDQRIVTRLHQFSRCQLRVRRLLVFVDSEIPALAELSAMTLQLRHDMRWAG